MVACTSDVHGNAWKTECNICLKISSDTLVAFEIIFEIPCYRIVIISDISIGTACTFLYPSVHNKIST